MSDVDRQYQEKQRWRYEAAVADTVSPGVAMDALWRAASAAGYLHSHEVSQEHLTPARISDLVNRLGWG